GGNDGAILSGTADPAALIELGNASAQDIDPLTGTFEITDADVGDTLTPSIVGTAAVKLNGGTYTLPAGAAALIANGALTLTGATSTGGGAAIGYSYDPGPANLDFLSAGDTLTITYQVKVNDGTSDSATQDVTFTITGTNDAPVFAAEATEFSAIGSVEQVNTQAVGNQYTPLISNLADDRFLVTWADTHDGQRKGQILDANGDPAGGEFSIMPAASDYWMEQIELADGRTAVISRSGEVFGKIVGVDGVIEPGTIEHMTNSSGYTRTAALTGGGFVIAASVNGYVNIGIQAYDGQGIKVGAQFTVPSGTFNEFVVKDTVALNDGGYLLLWDNVGGGLKAQRFDSGGNSVGSTYSLGTSTSDIPLYGDIDSACL
ncbi:MAG: VCBS domain-containing protein, partial [Hyphomicrobium sp.]